jgi:hypothetical protein
MASNTALAAYKSGVRARGKKTKRRAKTKVSLALAMGFAPVVYDAISSYQIGGVKLAISNMAGSFTGFSAYENQFKPKMLTRGLLPVGVGYLIHKVAGKTGINRAMGKFIPWVNI